jgi:type III pantothenate kinase
MLLTIDVGNTSVGAAVFDRDEIRFKNKLGTPDRINPGFVKNLVNVPHPDGIDSVIVSSVVPFLDGSLDRSIESLFGKKAFFISHRTDTGIKLNIDFPEELGADRIADAAGGLCLARPPLIIIDSGTATTFDIVNRDGEYIGGCIFPGIELSIRSLASNTAKLDRIMFTVPQSILGTNTEDNIRSGIYYSCLGGLEFMINEYKKIIGPDTQVIATGGVSFYFQNRINNIDIYEPDLIFLGLRSIYLRNQP